MKYLILSIAMISCSLSNKNERPINDPLKKVRIFDTKCIENYSFLYGVSNNDTIVFVMNTNLLNTCKKEIKHIEVDKNLKKVSNVKTDKGSIYFKFLMPSSNGGISIPVSEAPPNRNKDFIYTYSSYPYYLESCQYLH